MWENAFSKWRPSSLAIGSPRAPPDFISLPNLPSPQSSFWSANLTFPLFFLKAICGFPLTPIINPNWSLQPHVSTLLSSPLTPTRNTLCSLPPSLSSTCCSLSLTLSPQALSFHLVKSSLSWWSKLPWHPLQEVFSYCLKGEKVPIICAPTVPYADSYPRACHTVIIAFKFFSSPPSGCKYLPTIVFSVSNKALDQLV